MSSSKLKIELPEHKGPNAQYTTGDTITGRLEYDYTRTSELCDVSIVLIAKVETKSRASNNKNIASRLILDKRQRLYNGPIRPDLPNSWQFAISIPSTVSLMPDAPGHPESGARDRYCRKVHPMPPTLDCWSHNRNELHAGGRIAYSLVAVVHDRQNHRMNMQKLSITYLPSCRTASEVRKEPSSAFITKGFAFQSNLFQPQIDPHGLREKAKSLFHAKEAPLANWSFNITAEIPTRAHAGSPIDLKLKLEHTAPDAGSLIPPEVRVKYVLLKLLARTHVQFEQWSFAPNAADVVADEVWSHASANPVPFLREQNYVQRLTWTPFEHLPPDFETSYIHRTHAWSLECKVECCGQEFAFNRTIPMRLKPRLNLSSESPKAGALREKGGGLKAREIPPRYKATPSPSYRTVGSIKSSRTGKTLPRYGSD